MSQGKVRNLLLFIFSNFGPLIVFYGTLHFLGLKPAIVLSLIFTAGEILYKKIKKEKLTVFFKFCAATTVIFGAFDLTLQKSVLFKYEAALTNFFVAGFFGISLRSEKSLIQEFAGKKIDPAKFNSDHEFFFRVFTGIWTGYYLIKSCIYFWLASRTTLEETLILRATAGNISDYVLVGLSFLGGRPLFKLLKSLGVLPSQRMQQHTS